jgi:hypothetical protein
LDFAAAGTFLDCCKREHLVYNLGDLDLHAPVTLVLAEVFLPLHPFDHHACCVIELDRWLGTLAVAIKQTTRSRCIMKALKVIGKAFDEVWLTIAGNYDSASIEAARC